MKTEKYVSLYSDKTQGCYNQNFISVKKSIFLQKLFNFHKKKQKKKLYLLSKIVIVKLVDGHGWAPTRRIKDVVWGLYSLFDDLLNFDDPLNLEAAEHFQADQTGFRSKVRDYIDKYAKGWTRNHLSLQQCSVLFSIQTL